MIYHYNDVNGSQICSLVVRYSCVISILFLLHPLPIGNETSFWDDYKIQIVTVAICLIILGACMNILFIIKVTFLCSSRVGSHEVPSLTHVSKSKHGGNSQYGGKVPTYEPREIIRILFIFSKVGYWLFCVKIFGTCVGSWVEHKLDPTINTCPKPCLRKSVVM